MGDAHIQISSSREIYKTQIKDSTIAIWNLIILKKTQVQYFVEKLASSNIRTNREQITKNFTRIPSDIRKGKVPHHYYNIRKT